MKIAGNQTAETITGDLKKRPLPETYITAFVMENDKKSFGFVKQKKSVAAKLGIEFKVKKITANNKTSTVKKGVKDAAANPECGGIIVQLPLADRLNKNEICNVIPAKKDIDVLGASALGHFYQQTAVVLPPAVGVLKTLLADRQLEISRARVAVIGAGDLTGRPIATWLTGRCREIFILDKGSDFQILNQADIVISGTGQPALIRPEQLKTGAAFIDFGYGSVKTASGSTLSGDLNTQNELELEKLSFYTPTPGGTGPILVAEIFKNFYALTSNLVDTF
jgi:methylenetetrahydrofolate dehydrogenase (NADP+)/methenyltetrahydrofolate cyclohydrolase